MLFCGRGNTRWGAALSCKLDKIALYPGPQNRMLMGGPNLLLCGAGDYKITRYLGGPNLLFCGAGEDKITRYLGGLTCYSVGPATAK